MPRTTNYSHPPAPYTAQQPRSAWYQNEQNVKEASENSKTYLRLPSINEQEVARSLLRQILPTPPITPSNVTTIQQIINAARKESGTGPCWLWGYRYQYTPRHYRAVPYFPHLRLLHDNPDINPYPGMQKVIDPARYLFWAMWGPYGQKANIIPANEELCPHGWAFYNANTLLTPERFSLPACIHPGHLVIHADEDRLAYRSEDYQHTYYKRKTYYTNRQLPVLRSKRA